MTATPIPRTLQLTQWGEMQVSRIAQKPAGRQPIATRIASGARLDEIVARMAAALDRGERAYWVVRAITGGEHDDSIAAEDRYAELSKLFPDKVGLAHGELDVDVREKALSDFAAGRTQILVATTVIEVGVDVPNATALVVLDADRFGYAQLHQLRGRIGRGRHPGVALLVTDAPAGQPGRARVETVAATTDGMRLAMADLEARDQGDLLGPAQSGRSASLRLVRVQRDEQLILAARDEAARLVATDPDLRGQPALAARVAQLETTAAVDYLDKA
jgi:ATP-dependent DNA helicase RecG